MGFRYLRSTFSATGRIDMVMTESWVFNVKGRRRVKLFGVKVSWYVSE